MSANTFGEVLLWLIGLAIAIVILVYIMRWLYRRSTKETAFVRTGFLGEKVVVNGGAFVIPVLHEITPVNMNVMRIEVIRRDDGALITRNRMRVDIIAEFFVRVGASAAERPSCQAGFPAAGAGLSLAEVETNPTGACETQVPARSPSTIAGEQHGRYPNRHRTLSRPGQRRARLFVARFARLRHP